MAEEHRLLANDGLTVVRAYSWLGVFGGLLVTVAIVVLATVVGSIAAAVFDHLTSGGRVLEPGEHATLSAVRLVVFLVVFQAASVVLVLFAARAFGRNGLSPLAIVVPDGGGPRLLSYSLLLLALASVFTVIVYKMARNALLNDLLLFRDMLATRAWWGVALAAVVGAPIAEELVFRGLMYGVLRASPVGAVAGAVITAAAWAGVHAQYTIYGMTAIFLIGLYLAWVREKTGSVLAPMVCHAIYNASVLAVLLLAPVWFLEPG